MRSMYVAVAYTMHQTRIELGQSWTNYVFFFFANILIIPDTEVFHSGENIGGVLAEIASNAFWMSHSPLFMSFLKPSRQGCLILHRAFATVL